MLEWLGGFVGNYQLWKLNNRNLLYKTAKMRLRGVRVTICVQDGL